MLQSIKRYWLVLTLLLAGSQSMFGFALLGPFNESFQTPVIGYGVSGLEVGFGNQNGSVDNGGPKNIGQGYRWNIPTVYYAEDASWIGYFGSNGIVEVDKAFALFNSLSNVSSYSADLSEWPFDSRRVNGAAEAFGLIDVKSTTMSLLMEQLGLAQPDRYVWTLRGRALPVGAACPNFAYLVIQRNYDPTTQIYSPFVNDTLYGYVIAELCAITPAPFGALQADAVEYTADPTTANSAVAAAVLQTDGMYYTGLTRDDIGGLRYLYQSNNIYREAGPTGSDILITNQQQLLVTSNLALFTAQALTNDGPTLQLLYPDLEIISNGFFFSNVVTTNVTVSLASVPGTSGNFNIVFTTNLTVSVQQFFTHVFGNVVTNFSFAREFVVTNITTIGPRPGTSGLITTNTVSFTNLVAVTNGDFFIVPTNLCGGFTNFIVQLVQTNAITNFLPFSTNALITGTNLTGTAIVSATTVTFFTNTIFVVNPVACGGVSSPGLREGIEKINFVRLDFDSLVDSSWGPVTQFLHPDLCDQ